MPIEIDHISFTRVTPKQADKMKKQGKSSFEVSSSPPSEKFDPVKNAKEDIETLELALGSPDLLRGVKAKIKQKIGERKVRLKELQKEKNDKRTPIFIAGKGRSSLFGTGGKV